MKKTLDYSWEKVARPVPPGPSIFQVEIHLALGVHAHEFLVVDGVEVLTPVGVPVHGHDIGHEHRMIAGLHGLGHPALEGQGGPLDQGRLYLFGVLTNETYLGRRYSLLFDIVCQPANCARAIRSDRNEQH